MQTRKERLTEKEVGYIAGVIDGEGCLTVTKTKNKNYASGFRYIPVLFIGNTNLDFLQYLKTIIGAGSIISKRERRLNRKPMYYLQLYANTLRKLLPIIIDLLKIKKEQTELLIKFLQLTEGHENYDYRELSRLKEVEEIYQKVRALNGRKGKKEVMVEPSPLD